MKNSKNNIVKISDINVRTLTASFHEFSLSVHGNFDIIAVSETGLN